MSEEVKDIKNSYSDLKTATLNDIEYMDYDKLDKEVPISQDISADNINESVPLLDEPKEPVDDKEITMEDKMDDVTDVTEDTSKPSKESSENPSKGFDNLFFRSLNNIKEKSVKQTYKSNDSSTSTESSGGGGIDSNLKKIHLTEKYDFF